MNDQKIISSILDPKYAEKVRVLKTISLDEAKKYQIPDFALRYDGINAPEAGVFVTSNTKLDTGDLVRADFLDEFVVITHVLPDNEYIATKAITLSKEPPHGDTSIPTVT